MHKEVKPKAVISLCDYTTMFLKPWLRAGYHCFAFDIQHDSYAPCEDRLYKIGGTIEDNFEIITRIYNDYDIHFVAAFPPCTDLAVSGAAHFEAKRKKDKDFQHKAMRLFALCEHIAMISGAPYFIENPVSVISTMWRKPNYSFHPWEYGSYLPEDDIHPLYPHYIKPRDAYPKKTCLWTGNGFQMPDKEPVDVDPGYSTQHSKLGGKSLKTKNIRSATPRGFSLAVFEKYAR
jgi:hypothetical protein